MHVSHLSTVITARHGAAPLARSTTPSHYSKPGAGLADERGSDIFHYRCVQASAVDASEERDDALTQLDARDEVIQDLRAQAEAWTIQLEEREGMLGELQLTSQRLRLELESHLASRDAQVWHSNAVLDNKSTMQTRPCRD